VGPSYVYKFEVDRIYNFRDIATLLFWRFALILTIRLVIFAACSEINGKIYFRDRNYSYFGQSP